MVDLATSPLVMSSTHQPVALEAPVIRRRVRALLVRWGLAAERIDDALLVIEELVANALDHAGTPFQLVVRLDGEALRVAVRDGSARSPHVQPFDPHAARGRGLQLVTSLSRRWGCEHHPEGKTVWADLAA